MLSKIFYTVSLLFIVLFSVHANTISATDSLTSSDTLEVLTTQELPNITIIPQKKSNNDILNELPGSGAFINEVELKKLSVISGNEVFKRVAGLNVVDEEGSGLRVNIGIRGLDPDRSSGVLMLEDGIPIQLNPYGEPEMYYTPAMERMSSIEVVKGSGQILFGPRTIGGVINYITADAPVKGHVGKASFKGGSGRLFSSYIDYGVGKGNANFRVNYLHKQATRLGTLKFNVDDFNAKLKLKLGKKSVLGFKGQLYNEKSNSTYVGLTTPMFENDDKYTIVAPDDLLKIKRFSVSATHKHFFNTHLNITNVGYAYTITRDWRRQGFSYSKSAGNQTGSIFGDTTVANGAIYMLNETGFRNRTFWVYGLESKIDYRYNIKRVEGNLQAGIRGLYENALDQEKKGNSPKAVTGQIQAEEFRPGWAISGYIENKFTFLKKITITAGVRLESYNYKREIRMYKNAAGQYRDTNIVAKNRVFAFIPGVSISYNPKEKMTIFAGVHRGFSPPGLKNSISASGEILKLEPQLSWNFEVGTRSEFYKGLNMELTVYYIDFQKQVIPVSESSGGTGTGFINAGRTKHYGLESGLSINFGEMFNKKYDPYFNINTTYNVAKLSSDRFKKINADTVNINGYDLPYAPRIFLSAVAGLLTPFGLNLQMVFNYTGKQFTDEIETITPTANGRAGQIPAYFTMDAAVSYIIPKAHTTIGMNFKNITNSQHIVSRRPQGIKVANPFYIGGTLEFTW
ncbi:MAG: TonB-dependent receptor [Sphingobacteriales bacterium]|nr:TonB-dependent receptor [Sphingobacteriales bacterium]